MKPALTESEKDARIAELELERDTYKEYKFNHAHELCVLQERADLAERRLRDFRAQLRAVVGIIDSQRDYAGGRKTLSSLWVVDEIDKAFPGIRAALRGKA